MCFLKCHFCFAVVSFEKFFNSVLSFHSKCFMTDFLESFLCFEKSCVFLFTLISEVLCFGELNFYVIVFSKVLHFFFFVPFSGLFGFAVIFFLGDFFILFLQNYIPG